MSINVDKEDSKGVFELKSLLISEIIIILKKKFHKSLIKNQLNKFIAS